MTSPDAGSNVIASLARLGSELRDQYTEVADLRRQVAALQGTLAALSPRSFLATACPRCLVDPARRSAA